MRRQQREFVKKSEIKLQRVVKREGNGIPLKRGLARPWNWRWHYRVDTFIDNKSVGYGDYIM